MSQIQPDPTPGDTSWFTHDRFGMSRVLHHV